MTHSYSDWKFDNDRDYLPEDANFARTPVEAKFAKDGHEIRIIVTHFKSLFINQGANRIKFSTICFYDLCRILVFLPSHACRIGEILEEVADILQTGHITWELKQEIASRITFILKSIDQAAASCEYSKQS